MATLSYVNDVSPIGGIPFNPGLEEVLDATPTVGATTASLYELVNNNGGPFNGFKVQFTSNVNGTGDFSYLIIGETGEIKPSGTITGMFLRAPDGTVLMQVTAGASGFGNAKLETFYNLLTYPNYDSPVEAVRAALDSLFGKPNLYNGSPIADHITALGTGASQMFGYGGDDTLTAMGNARAELVGGTGNDLIRIENGTYRIHGANADGSGGARQTDTVEIVAIGDASSTAHIEQFTNIDVLRFVAGPIPPASQDGTSIYASFQLSEIGEANMPSSLLVHGSAKTSPYTSNNISIYTDFNEDATRGVKLDLSDWRFKNWDETRSFVSISTAGGALRDVVTGTKVADGIYTYGGRDVLRGGGGADELAGGDDNDVFVYGRNEAVAGEYVSGGSDDAIGGIDTVRVLASNDFTGVDFWSIERLEFAGKATAVFDQHFIGNFAATVVGDDHANVLEFRLANPGAGLSAIDLSDLKFRSWTKGADTVKVTGTSAFDSISGSSRADIIDGGSGSDLLQGNGGADAFRFATALSKGVDHIADFSHRQGDVIQLDRDIFTALKAGGLAKAAFQIGTAAKEADDRIIYDELTGVLRYDDDGTGAHKAKIFAVLDTAPSLAHTDFFVV